jgi:hypothetical protein
LLQVVYLYIGLLIVEGSIRKWIPPLSGPFLLVRDPLAIYIWIKGRQLGFGSSSLWSIFDATWVVLTAWGLFQVIVLELDPRILAYGWRSYVLHLPVIFILGGILKPADLRTLCRWLLAVTPLITLLMVAQYLSPSDGILNRAVGGPDATQLSGALGHVRPAGPFSFITGPALFFPLMAALALWGLIDSRRFGLLLPASALIATLVAMPVSISRSLALGVGLVFLCGVAAFVVEIDTSTISVARALKFLGATMVSVVVLIALTQVPVVADAINTFAARWDLASRSESKEGGANPFVSRLVTTMIGPYLGDQSLPIMGVGMGAGSSFAASISGHGVLEFGEGAGERELTELGSVVGSLFIGMRLVFALSIVFISLKQLAKRNTLPILLSTQAVLGMANLGLDQATSQGFLMVTVGLFVAACRLGSKTFAEPVSIAPATR